MFKINYISINLTFLLIGYLVGSISFGIIISKLKGKDLRKEGSNNAGATNAMRVMGLKFGALVFILDFLKSYLVIMLAFTLKALTKNIYIIPMIAGLGAVIGHIFPIFHNLKGGKGVSCFIGMIFAFDFMIFTIYAMVFVFIVLVSKYVSLASTITSATVPFLGFVPSIYSNSTLSFLQENTIYPIHTIILIIASIAIVIKHIPNYIRLFNHKENKLKL
ncbi:acyl-phosphate glycerol 3-phosphate acyltransferase [[Mycoplasma] phocae]|uniref:Glycerol-3-phosphate acyltransferase n=1 Tax=[Mycoplasma] phocae TaxID=142651 RepID=A0A2Z5IRL0_9BACT|nr:glycerol-3-phosphate 1-O-acyltransferase PlsY [[Mycoplasma] phocae]AXE60996.1 acyl-phosphate glycerol 3-phosphate acyltransferase [[Mycoplasma] phocae]